MKLYFGPAPPNGQQTNWIPIRADGPFEALCRLYGPKKLFFDKTWKLPDIQGRADEPVTTIASLEGGRHQGVTHHLLDEPS